MSTTYPLFVQCAVGLEELLRAELRVLGLCDDVASGRGAGASGAILRALSPRGASRATPGGVEVRGGIEGLWAICLRSRLADNVRLRFKPFVARDFDRLQSSLRKLPWRAYLAPGTHVSVRVSSRQSRLWHTGAIAERVAAVLTEHAGLKVQEGGSSEQVVFVRAEDDEIQVSLDASGPRLSQRGYRPHVEQASVRESLAAALYQALLGATLGVPDEAGGLLGATQSVADEAAGLLSHAAGPGGAAPLAPYFWDPFCGAGTVVLEAMHIAHGGLAGGLRDFAFERWRNHDAQAYGQYKLATHDAVARASPWPELRALGSDSSERALAAARHNTQLADASLGGRLSPSIAWLHGDVLGVMEQVPQGAFVLTNPPYGKRLPGGRPRAGPPTSRPSQVHPAVLQFLSVLERRPDLRPVVMLLGGEARHVLPSSAPALFRTQNGGLPVSARLLRGPGEP